MSALHFLCYCSLYIEMAACCTVCICHKPCVLSPLSPDPQAMMWSNLCCSGSGSWMGRVRAGVVNAVSLRSHTAEDAHLSCPICWFYGLKKWRLRLNDLTKAFLPYLGLPSSQSKGLFMFSSPGLAHVACMDVQAHSQGNVSLGKAFGRSFFFFLFLHIVRVISDYWLLAADHFLPTQTKQSKRNRWCNSIKKKSIENFPKEGKLLLSQIINGKMARERLGNLSKVISQN